MRVLRPSLRSSVALGLEYSRVANGKILLRAPAPGERTMGDEDTRKKQERASPVLEPVAKTPIAEIDVLWITAGLGCDGDTIAMTAATQPSIEDVVSGGLPWIPKVNFLNPFLAIENGN